MALGWKLTYQNDMNELKAIVIKIRQLIGVPHNLSIGRFAIIMTQGSPLWAINIHNEKIVCTLQELLFISDEELIVLTLTKHE